MKFILDLIKLNIIIFNYQVREIRELIKIYKFKIKKIYFIDQKII